MASKPDTWMPLYIADYLRKTMHLTRDQHGGYMLLLMACWDRGGRLPNDPGQLAGIARATPAEWRKLAPVLLPFFEIDGGDLIQGRVIEEHEKAARLSEARRAAGSQGGRPRKQTDAGSESKSESSEKPNAFATGKQNETPTRVASPSPLTPPTEVSVPNGTGAEAPPVGKADPLEALRALDPKAGAWRLCLKVLMDRGGFSEARARPLVGKWAKELDDPAALWRIAEAAWEAGTLDPVSYITAGVERQKAEADDNAAMLAPSLTRQRIWAKDWIDNPGLWRPGDRGPAPGQPGCRISAAILDEFGIGAAVLPFPLTDRRSA